MEKIILHINNSTNGGTGRAVKAVNAALKYKGFKNYIIVPRGELKKEVRIIGKKHFYFSRILSKFFEKTSKVSIQKDSFWPEIYCKEKSDTIINSIEEEKIDIIILYWYKNFIDTKTILNLKKKTGAKIYIYLMDEAPLTGGCHYSVNCKRYEVGCGKCPSVLGGKILKDITYFNAKQAKKNLIKSDVTILAPTSNSLLQAEKSYITSSLEKELIMLPVSYEKKDLNLEKAMKRWNLQKTNKIIFFGSQSLTDERKGMKYLVKSLKLLNSELEIQEKLKITLLIAGNNKLEEIEKLDFNIEYTGYLNDAELREAYLISDVLISPSIVDMGPMMVNEAIRYGTPVISFDIGVSQDIIIDGITGYKIKNKDYILMAQKIKELLMKSNKELRIMKEESKKIGEKKLSYDVFKNEILKFIN